MRASHAIYRRRWARPPSVSSPTITISPLPFTDRYFGGGHRRGALMDTTDYFRPAWILLIIPVPPKPSASNLCSRFCYRTCLQPRESCRGHSHFSWLGCPLIAPPLPTSGALDQIISLLLSGLISPRARQRSVVAVGTSWSTTDFRFNHQTHATAIQYHPSFATARLPLGTGSCEGSNDRLL